MILDRLLYFIYLAFVSKWFWIYPGEELFGPNENIKYRLGDQSNGTERRDYSVTTKQRSIAAGGRNMEWQVRQRYTVIL